MNNSRPATRFLGPEGKRNRANAALYKAMLCVAWGECEVIVGHHVNFQFDGDLSTEDEIPSADTLLFDHDIMGAVFGDSAVLLMTQIAAVRPYERERILIAAFNRFHPDEAVPLPVY